MGPIMDRFRGMCLFGASAMLAAGVFACASSNVVDSTAGTTGQIADVRVEQVGDTTQVTLLGVDHPVFTAFQETDPARVIIDLVSIHPEQLMEPVAVYDGLVDEVSLAPFSTGSGEAMTRVEISLAGPASYEVVPGDEGLVVHVSGMLAMADSGADDGMSLDDDPWAVMPDGGAMDESAAPMSDDDAETAWVAEAPEATMLTGVEAQVVDNGTLITLRANGTISSAITFTLENPDRLVLDLPDLKTEMSQPRVDVGAPHVERIRVGQHADLVCSKHCSKNPL